MNISPEVESEAGTSLFSIFADVILKAKNMWALHSKTISCITLALQETGDGGNIAADEFP